MTKLNRFWISSRVIGILSALVLQAGLAVPAFAQEVHAFDVDTTDAATAIHEFGTQSGVQILASADALQGKRLNKVSGELSTDDGLTKLLAGTGLAHQYVGDRAVAVVNKVNDRAGDAAANQAGGVARADGASDARGSQAEPKKSFWERVHLAQVDQTKKSGGDPVENSGAASNTKSGSSIDEIIVTAQKRSERLHDVPISIAVIGNEDIERRGLIGMEDYLRSIPGVNQIDDGPKSNAIVIRGITTSPEAENFAAGTTVATYFDETPITGAAGMGAGGIDMRPVDIERIEVLRGPQGTAYGSASLGGTLRIIPVKPQLDSFSAKLTASYSDTSGLGSDNSMIQGVVNIPIVVDKFALRAVGYRYDESGFYRNTAGIDPATIATFENYGLGDYVRGFVQDDRGGILSTGGRVAASWQMTEKLNLSMNFLTQKIQQDGLPSAMVGKYEQVAPPIAPQARVRGEAGEANDTDVDLTNLVLNYDLGWAALVSAASWVDSGSAWASDATWFLGFPSSTTDRSDFKSFTEETRLASKFAGRLQFLAGLYYENVDDHQLQTYDWPGSPATNPLPLFGLSATDPLALFDQSRKIDQRAVFGEISYDLTDKLKATVGDRFFKYRKTESDLTEGGLVGVPIGAAAQVRESSESNSSLKANLSYKPTTDSLLYASWAQGFRLGRPSAGLLAGRCDINNDGVVDGTNISIASTRTINSDSLDNYEIGGKLAMLDRRLVLDVAVYHIKWDGLPISTGPTGDCGDSYVANAGSATSDGVDFQASLLVLEGLRLDFGAGYTKAELSEDAPTLFAQKGARLPGSPRTSVSLAAQYDFNVAGHRAFVRADSFYTGKFFGNLQETPATMAGDYFKIDARVGVAIRNLSVELFVRNLTDEDAFTWRGTFDRGEFFGYRTRPRTVGIQLGYSFD